MDARMRLQAPLIRTIVPRTVAWARGQEWDVLQRAAPVELPEPEERDRPGPDPVGICCSGGGIRSAAYNLGALQALHDSRPVEGGPSVLAGADYLAAVSGGSYIAAALSMVQKERPEGVDDPPDGGDPWTFATRPPYAPGSPEETWLRNHSSYMAPGLAGKVGLVAAIVLGLLLNLVLVAALLLLVALPLGLLGAALHPHLVVAAGGELPWTASPGLLSRAIWAGGALSGLGLLVALLATATRLGDAPRNPTMRTAKVLAAAGLGILLAVIVLPWLIVVLRALVVPDMTAAELPMASGQQMQEASGGLNRVLGALAALGLPPLAIGLLRTVFERGGRTVLPRLGKLLQSPRIAAAIAAPVLLVGGFLLAYNLGVHWGWHPVVGSVLAGAAATVVLLFFLLDPTASSLYPLYKRRLSSAFAVYRHSDKEARERPYGQHIKLSEARIGPPDGPRAWPRLLICAAANISDDGLTPPGRNAVPFVFSDDYVGGPGVGYVRTADYEAALGPARARDATVPAAVAMSGAAIAPSMGRYSSRSHTFLLALANARLGVWLPNPRYVHYAVEQRKRRDEEEAQDALAKGLAPPQHRDGAAERVHSTGLRPWRRNWKRPRMTWLLREMRGLNRSTSRYLYVSDGGHYEDLGLVELLRRGCTEIYCFDASGDGGDLRTIGETIALARSELGIEIPLNPDELRTSGQDLAKKAHIVVEFRYPPDPTKPGDQGRPGTIIYTKALVTEDAPWDVRAYRAKEPRFPNHPTTDQLYTDTRFEAYRALGQCTARAALAEMAKRTRPGAESEPPASASDRTADREPPDGEAPAPLTTTAESLSVDQAAGTSATVDIELPPARPLPR